MDKKISVNGVTLSYQNEGSGRPLILLHGNGETHEIFDRIIPQLSKRFEVFAIDSRSHGGSTKVKELRYDDMAEDIAEFIKALSLENAAVYGFSDGGIIGLLLAITHGELVGSLVVSGANISPNGLKKSALFGMKIGYFFSRNPKLKLMVKQPNISAEQLGRITVPTLVLAGENDLIQEAHTRKIAAAISGSQLKILPGETHGSYVVHSEKLIEILNAFL